ncbi:YciI family protein [Herbidospora cretacea]|uniref:YciI family protein n=1 Tax=Herbidospora cretacea TaxID=28444 RepID=UPI000774AD17|nr:YciI family protein [Herbidospora cretacea]
MKYMFLIYATGEEGGEGDFQAWMDYDKSIRESGHYVTGEALSDPGGEATIVRTVGGEHVFTDGPFAEGREVLGGIYVVDVPDLETAKEWAARCPGSSEGVVVIRPVAQF